ncbi:bifunctional PIG-L family deacetylase/class I SAM-dependent methyltransferase [Amycolatopsis rhabdoformis]|uniref:Bifunctional PIG-L family deacetylase/class I SAM-dependent methyltransferase n=1 Tax=Amycolatopsis rhabdoformis TaxID=1448059 RepID=A0ABZ1IJS5_9PSEU|nr:bifunctional PIG-L family deacetylase/class I SAM-dependent methyltransferase [Amycolatopsis rhabdoformis]WSE34662.1 bifunctional PIG-L family deacetylase/class I SAM-dependent methyltransferase [Amycolatopsis rhabdoformis]
MTVEWQRKFPEWPDDAFDRALVVAAHPDDETLGASGLLQHLHGAGTAVTLAVATDGEAAFPDSAPAERRELGRVRRRELRESLRAQGLSDVEPVWLGLPDSALADHEAELTAALRERAAGHDLVLLPWPDDPHPDHRAAGRAALAAAPVSAHRWSYPIWLWHQRSPSDPGIPWQHARSYGLTDRERGAKAAAVAAFTSQLKPGPRGEDPILPPEVLAHFAGSAETFFREPPARSAPTSRFVQLYDSAEDPWHVADAWYERRKRRLLLASLPDERYGTAVEPGCGLGVLTRELAARCDRLLAFDPVQAAVDRATRAVAGLSEVDVYRATVPDGLPTGPVDLLVYSELLYYLDDTDLDATVEASANALRPGGHLAAVHWRPWAPEAPRDGAEAHARLLAHPAFEPVVSHTDEAFLLHVLRRR